jgi:hypothetical protein
VRAGRSAGPGPRQNRVTPFGDLVADPSRGTLTGNRGCLHDGDERIVRYRVGRRWIACALEFRGRRRPVMPPGRWTALFFLDEATALAAGHRPCFECRREDAERFRAAWAAGNGLDGRPGADDIDRVLEAERLAGPGRKRTWRAAAAELPDGAFVRDGDLALAVAGDALLPWCPGGYGAPRARPPGRAAVEVLTPPSTVRAIAAGYGAGLASPWPRDGRRRGPGPAG